MAREREDAAGFTVSDRRSTVRDPRPSSDQPTASTPTAEPTASRDAELDDRRTAGPVDLSGLLLSLASTAMLYLGAPTPEGKTGPVNLARAQEMIDLLAVLERKTAGNLTPDESALLINLLYSLRLRYVEAAR
jgi:hypothetical protein